MRTDVWLQLAENRLRQADVESPRLEAQVLASHILRVDRPWLIAHAEHDFPDLAGEALLQRRESHEPLAYIIGRREFYGRPFGVTSAVLIPRQETEHLVEWAIREAPQGAKLLDIGTGSGCIAISIALERPDLDVSALDISPMALEVARQNAADLNARVEFIEADLAPTNRSFDILVSNPPYIGIEESLPPDLAHEPAQALFAEDHGLALYRRLALLDIAPRIALEVGHQQAETVSNLFIAQTWTPTGQIKDLSGIERVLSFAKELKTKKHLSDRLH
jgi:release factor glutamine methyltransferase